MPTLFLPLTSLALPFLAGVLALLMQNWSGIARLVCQGAMGLSLIVFAISLIYFPDHQFIHFFLFQFDHVNFVLAFQWDALSRIMMALVLLISLIVQSYSARYLSSDRTQGRFMAQLTLAAFSVLLLVLSGNLLTAFIAWQFIGISLYLLLNHYHYDEEANRAAKKKFIINRLGDISFLMAVLLCYIYFHTSDFSDLFSANAVFLHFYDHAIPVNSMVLILIFLAVMTKSAQFPFHIWLPDTMETPTPVSAFMHAGIINAGGFLLVRLSPWFNQSSHVLILIFLVGALTLLLAGFFMLTQTDIKKQLAYSTMGQMGFMLLQISLGFYASAIFHLISHGLFKASLFLSAGSGLTGHILKTKKTAVSFNKKMALLLSIILILSLFWLFAFQFILEKDSIYLTNPLIACFISLTLAQILWKSFNFEVNQTDRLILSLGLFLVFAFYLYVIKPFDHFLLNEIAVASPLHASWQWLPVSFLVAAQILFWFSDRQKWMQTKLAHSLYMLSFNKLGVEDLYRHYLLYPFRRLGDYLNQNWLNPLSLRVLTVYLILNLLLGIVAWLTGWKIQQGILFSLNLLLFIFFLIIANRPKKIKQLIYCLALAEIALVNVGLCSISTETTGIMLYQGFNVLFILLALVFLVRNLRQRRLERTIKNNQLPWFSLYLSVLLMLLIGIPGTASFNAEFFVLKNLLVFAPMAAIVFSAAMVLLSMVVLHALQEYVFSKTALKNYHPNLTVGSHLAAILAIGINFYNGLFPVKIWEFILNLWSSL